MSSQPTDPSGPATDPTRSESDTSSPVSPTGYPDAAGTLMPPVGTHAPYAGHSGDSPMKAAAKRTMLFGVLWFAAGIIFSVVTIAMGSHGVIFWGLSLYGVVQIVRGAVAYGKA